LKNLYLIKFVQEISNKIINPGWQENNLRKCPELHRPINEKKGETEVGERRKGDTKYNGVVMG
jgi:hypothetical protein